MIFPKAIPWIIAMGIAASASYATAASRGLDLEIKASDAKNAPVAANIRLYDASYALVIGIDNYTSGWPRLRNAVADARAVAKRLDSHGFDVTLKLNLKANDFRQTLREFFAKTGRDPEARLLLWYAGHGHTVNGEGFLVPADAPTANDPDFLVDALPLRDFGSLVRLARSKHVLSIFDACFAGTVFEARGGVPTAAITRKTTKPVRQFITSGDAGQQVRDDGSFREYFLRALSGDEKADFNDDGYVTGEELGLFLSQRMATLTQASQTPQTGKLHDVRFNQGDFVFALGRSGGVVAAPKSGSGFKLDDLEGQRKQDQIKQAWSTKLAEMKAAYQKAQKFEAGGGAANLKTMAWQRFVTAFAEDNPFSDEDDLLRRLAASRVEHWMSQKLMASVVTPQTAPAKTWGGGNDLAIKIMSDELIDSFSTEKLLNRKTRVAIWPFQEKDVPISVEAARTFDTELLTRLKNAAGRNLVFVGRRELRTLTADLEESNLDIDNPVALVASSAKIDVLIIGTLQLQDGRARLSYKALGASGKRVGRILASTSARTVRFQQQPATLTLDLTLRNAVRKLAGMARDLQELTLNGIRFEKSRVKTSFGHYIEERVADEFVEVFNNILSNRVIRVNREATGEKKGQYSLSGTYWDLGSSVELRLDLEAPDGRVIIWRGLVSPPQGFQVRPL